MASSIAIRASGIAESSRSAIAQSSDEPRSCRLKTGFLALMRRASVTSALNSPAFSIHSIRCTSCVSCCSSLARALAKCDVTRFARFFALPI